MHLSCILNYKTLQLVREIVWIDSYYIATYTHAQPNIASYSTHYHYNLCTITVKYNTSHCYDDVLFKIS